MIYRIAAISSLVSLSACGLSVAELAKNADPKVCAAPDTTATVFAIMKQQAGISRGNLGDTGVKGNELLADITMTTSNITSKSVDKDSQTVECNATVSVAGKGLSATVDQSVDYQVKPNLSDEDEIIVSVAQADTFSAVSRIAGSLLKVREKGRESAMTAAVAAPAATSPATSDVLASNDVPPASGTGYGDCSITVGGVRYLDIKKTCHIDTSGEDTTINTEAPGPTSYFAYISRDDKGGAHIYWNSKDKYNKADENLGDDFRSEGNCWKNAQAKICATL